MSDGCKCAEVAKEMRLMVESQQSTIHLLSAALVKQWCPPPASVLAGVEATKAITERLAQNSEIVKKEEEKEQQPEPEPTNAQIKKDMEFK